MVARWMMTLGAALLIAACASERKPAPRSEVPASPPRRAKAAAPAASAAALLEAALHDYQKGEIDAASTKASRAYELFAAAGDVRAAAALQIVGDAHAKRKACAEAAESYLGAVSIRERRLGPDHPLVAGSLTSSAGALSCLGKDEEAMSALRRAYEIEAAYPARLPERVEVARRLAALLQKRGELRRAESLLAESMTAVGAARGRADRLYFVLFGARDGVLRALGEKEAAAALWTGLPEADRCLPEPCPDPRAARPAATGQAKAREVPNTDRVLASLAPSFKACYDSGLANDHALVGRVILTLRLAPDGAVSQAKGHRIGNLDDGTLQCILEAAIAARFEAPGRSEPVVRVPLTFVLPAPAAAP
jgi:tetratricopeptide (TPR) repeat protein